ncbi:MAG: ABC transporter permease [Bryobacteraceae bacterium]|jgi:predicted permease
MRRIQQLLLKLRAIVQRSQVEREMEAELAAHLEAETRELTARGLDAAEARRRAAATIGRMDLIKEECRDSRGTASWEHLKQDVAFGLRLLFKNRTFSSMALATMALAIGSTTAVFSVVEGVLLRPLPFAAPERLYHATDLSVRGHFDVLRSNSRQADYAAHLGVQAFNTRGQDWPERVKGSQVSANFFRVLGVPPLFGHDFADGADRPGAPRTAILSHAFWSQRFGARRDVLGRQLLLDDVPFEIIGVMPAGFQYPSPDAGFWIPMRLDPRAIGDYWGANACSTFARLRNGVTPQAAISELRGWTPRVHAMFPWRMPDSWAGDVTLEPMREHMVAGVRERSVLLLGAVALVLLIAIVNVANLMIGQTAARRGEFALRISLGATPGRLARQLLTESLLLAAAGGLLGILLAFGQLELLKHWLPPDTPRLAEVSIDRTIIAFAAAVSMGSGLLFGLLPAWRARSQNSMVLADGPRSTLSRMGLRTDAVLVTSEAAFATVLLVGAGLLLHSFWTMLHVAPGYRVESVVTAELSPGRAISASLDRTVALYGAVREKMASYPGVTNVAAMSRLPLSSEIAAVTCAIEDHPRPAQAPQFVLWTTAATPEHLDTLGIRLLQGRGFTDADREDSDPVVLVSRSTAQKFWPAASPIGRRLRPVWQNRWQTIVGVVDDVKTFSLTGPPEWVDGEIYVPLTQAAAAPQSLALVARVGNDPSAFEQTLPRIVREVCATCAVSKIARMDTIVSGAVAAPRSLAWLVGGFALLALTLAAAGIYGVVSHGVLRRTRELGVRLALGASPGSVAWLVVKSSLRQVVVGTVAGLAASWALARWIESLLYGVAGHDPVSFSLPPVVLVAVGLLASLLPMVRAARIDPAKSLREG